MGLAVVLIAIFGAPLFAEPVSRQADITEQFGVPESTLSNWLGGFAVLYGRMLVSPRL